ncbi:helix-turn-helix domain-containing protein [Bacillus sp. B1-b2]|uniref:helix-turn-helix domain-containing protein n=1 Tax=Bacillus sp. B1-b2 TaxID=2653201 RepID=UPI00126238A4|nr:helix-turn-helix transcriptional regulator [Bacillus sp. B1-b2]KAB7671709.1 helix-turn-helix transcriptional regulator [Bacillus sp. B1-b2]
MIGERIRYLRLQKGYSISRLAKESGVSKTYLSNLDRGIQDNPSLQILEKIAKKLGTSVDHLISEDFNKNN